MPSHIIRNQPTETTETIYLFIDGGYLKKFWIDLMQKWLETELDDCPPINFEALKNYFHAKKVFYYDCLDEIKKPEEDETQNKTRIVQQTDYFNKIRSIEGVHVRWGHLAGRGKRTRQKEVDVLLAVDMMKHAHRGNMEKCILLAGDRDFKPVVEALVEMGSYVGVASEESSTSKELAWAADFHRKLTFQDCYNWLPLDLQKSHPIPQQSELSPRAQRPEPMKTGKAGGKNVELVKENNQNYLFWHKEKDCMIKLTSPDLIKLNLYFLLQYGYEIQWSPMPYSLRDSG